MSVVVEWVGGVPVFQPGGPGAIPGGNFYPGTECVSFVFCPDILLNTDSGKPAILYLPYFLIQSLLSPYSYLANGHLG